MPEFLEDMIDLCFKSVAAEGRRLLGTEATRMLEGAVDAVRRLVIVQYVLMSACFLWAASFLASGLLVAAHWDQVHGHDFPPELIFSVATWLVSSVVLAVSVRRSLWMRALGAARKATQAVPEAPLTESQIAAIVERTVRTQVGKIVGEEIRSALRSERAGEVS